MGGGDTDLHLPVGEHTVAHVSVKLELSADQGGPEVEYHAAYVYRYETKKQAHAGTGRVVLAVIDIFLMEHVCLCHHHGQ